MRPPCVVASTDEYLESQDTMSGFTETRCLLGSEYRDLPDKLWQEFNNSGMNMEPDRIGRRTFFEKLVNAGFRRVKSNGIRYFVGLKLKR